MPAKRAGHRHNRVVGKFVKIPEPLVEGKVRCAACSKVVSLTPSGNLWGHRAPNGDPCAHRANYGEPVDLDSLPEVLIVEPHMPPPKQQETKQKRPEEKRPPRLEVGSTCADCGKWLPGERKVCGQCYVKRDTNRRKRDIA